jgi:hypothetical protein
VTAVPPWFKQHVLSRLSGVRPDSRDPRQFYARCPAHNDRHNSFAIRPGDKMAVVYSCKLGCDEQAIRQALVSLGVDEDYLGIYGTPEYAASRRIKGTSEERRKLDRITGLLTERMTPAMLKVRVLATIEGIEVPAERKPFLALAERAGVRQSQRYEAWAQVYASQAQPECVTGDHVVLTPASETCQAPQVTAGVQIPETGKRSRKPENSQNGTSQAGVPSPRSPDSGNRKTGEPDMSEAVRALHKGGLTGRRIA